MAKNRCYEKMLTGEFLQAVEEMPVFIVPCGLLEWHGDHLPLGQDALKARGICEAIADKLQGGIVLPPVYFGRPGYSSYAGTLTFSEACLTMLFTELLTELEKVGAKVVLLLTGHYGPCQVDFVKKVAADFAQTHPGMRILAQPEYEDIAVDGKLPCDHAGIWETSMFWYFHPELTHMEELKLIPNKKRYYDNPPNDYYYETEEWEFSNDVQNASPALGAKAVDTIAEHLAQKLRDALSEVR